MSGTGSPVLAAVGQRPVILCFGSGGVGKTTTAAALGLALAARGERVVVLTIDPARRLADALGLSSSDGGLHPIVMPKGSADLDQRGQLTATMLDPADTLRGIIERDATSTAQATRVLTNPMFANLAERLSGTNEYMATERLLELHLDERFDRVIVDTPPSNHAFDFLDSPTRLARFLDHPLYRSVLGGRSLLGRRPAEQGQAGRGLLSGRSLWAEGMVRLLGRLVGGRLVGDVLDFFGDFSGIDDGFRTRASEIEALLSGPDTARVVITTPRPDRLAAVRWILDELEQRGQSPDALVINRVLPIVPDNGALPDSDQCADRGPLEQNYGELATLATAEQHAIAELLDDPGKRLPTLQLPEQREPVVDIVGMSRLAAMLSADERPSPTP